MSGKRKLAKKKKTGKRHNSNRIERMIRIKRKQVNDVGASNRPTKITDLNDHCLANIFNHLDLSDLIDVANSNTRFLVSTRIVFEEKFSEKIICVSNKYGRRVKTVLRKFGHLIKCLKVQYNPKYHRFNHALEATISKHCHETLLVLYLNDFNESLFNRIKRPFKAVKNVNFTKGVLGEFVINLQKWFPSLVSLWFEPKTENANFVKCIKQNVATLKDLKMIKVSNVNLKKAIEMSPELKSLYLQLYGIIDEDLLKCVNEKQPMLEDLTICGLRGVNRFDGPIHFANLQKLKVTSYDPEFPFIPLTTNKLDTLDLDVLHADGNCAKFISNQKICKILKLNDWWLSSAFDEIAKSIALLAGLEDIFIEYFGLNSKQAEILSLLKSCKSLKKLVIEGFCNDKDESSKQYQAFKEGLHTAFEAKFFGSAWQPKYYENGKRFYAEYKKREEK